MWNHIHLFIKKHVGILALDGKPYYHKKIDDACKCGERGKHIIHSFVTYNISSLTKTVLELQYFTKLCTLTFHIFYIYLSVCSFCSACLYYISADSGSHTELTRILIYHVLRPLVTITITANITPGLDSTLHTLLNFCMLSYIPATPLFRLSRDG